MHLRNRDVLQAFIIAIALQLSGQANANPTWSHVKSSWLTANKGVYRNGVYQMVSTVQVCTLLPNKTAPDVKNRYDIKLKGNYQLGDTGAVIAVSGVIYVDNNFLCFAHGTKETHQEFISNPTPNVQQGLTSQVANQCIYVAASDNESVCVNPKNPTTDSPSGFAYRCKNVTPSANKQVCVDVDIFPFYLSPGVVVPTINIELESKLSVVNLSIQHNKEISTTEFSLNPLTATVEIPAEKLNSVSIETTNLKSDEIGTVGCELSNTNKRANELIYFTILMAIVYQRRLLKNLLPRGRAT